MNNIVCSIIIPAFNAEKSIIRCLESFQLGLKSNLPIELILVNDGSKDNTSSIAESYLSKFDNCKVINKINGGVSSARNVGIKEAKGEYIFFCDADDEIIRPAFNNLINYIKDINCDIIVAKYVHSNDINTRNQDELKSNQLLNRDYIIKNVLSLYVKGCGPSSIWNKLYKRSIIIENGLLFDETRTHGEDWAFNIDFFNLASSLYVVDDIVYIYNFDGSQGGFEKYGGDFCTGLIDGHKKIIELNKKYCFFAADSFEFRNVTKRYIKFCIGCLESKKIKTTDKKRLLKNNITKDALDLLLKLKKGDLPGWTTRNHFAIWLLKHYHYRVLLILHYRFQLKMIPD